MFEELNKSIWKAMENNGVLETITTINVNAMSEIAEIADAQASDVLRDTIEALHEENLIQITVPEMPPAVSANFLDSIHKPIEEMLISLREATFPNNIETAQMECALRLAGLGIPVAFCVPTHLFESFEGVSDRQGAQNLIVDSEKQILDYCAAQVGSLEENNRHPLTKALEALQGGHIEASQALSANITNTILEKQIHRRHGKINLYSLEAKSNADALTIQLGPTSVSLFPRFGSNAAETLTAMVVEPAFRYYGDPEDAEIGPFNRQLTCHHALAMQHYGTSQAIEALMLAVSVSCQYE